MADKEPMVVIKKITVVAAGGHGGAWKVAFADFMTALMAFFLVMWLVAQSEEVKKNVSDYFSTPSVIEYNFSNYGAELTLEKLFLDLINEPLNFFQAFMKPADLTPNIMSSGSRKMVLHQIADQLGDVAGDVQVYGDNIKFSIPADQMFLDGTGKPNSQFVAVMEKIKGLTQGLEDSNVYINSVMYTKGTPDNKSTTAKKISEKRLDLISRKIEVGLEHETVDVFGKFSIDPKSNKPVKPDHINGVLQFKINQKKLLSDGRKPREMKQMFDEKRDEDMDVYNDFVNRLVNEKKKKKVKK